MEREYKGMTMDELKKLFYESLEVYDPDWMNGKVYKDLSLKSQGASFALTEWANKKHRTEHFFWKGEGVFFRYLVEKEIKSETTGLRSIHLVEQVDSPSCERHILGFITKEDMEKRYNEIYHAYAWFFANHTYEIDVHSYAQYMAELDTFLKGFNEEFVDALDKEMKAERTARTECELYEDSMRYASIDIKDIFYAMFTEWRKMNPVENLIGKEVYVTTKGYSAIIEDVDSKFVYLEDGTKCKATSISVNHLFYSEPWVKEMMEAAAEKKIYL